MDFLKSTFNNRELSLIIWMTIVLVWIFSGSQVRNSFLAVIKSFFQKKILYSVLAMIGYVLLVLFILQKIGFWDMTMLKETCVWFLGGGFVLHLSVNKINNDEAFFKNFIIDTIKVAVVIAFVVNFYSFSLVVELILVPVMILIGGMKAMAETYHEYKDDAKYASTKKFLSFLLNVAGFTFAIYFVYKVTQNFNSFSNHQTIKTFLLPIILSLGCLPIMYVMALIMLYETLFIQLSFRIYKNGPLARYLNWRVLLACNFHVLRVRNFNKAFKAFDLNSKSAIDFSVKKAMVSLRSTKKS